jgi:hypothetical protein
MIIIIDDNYYHIYIYITYNYLYNVLVINSNVQNLNTKYYYCQKVSANQAIFVI